MKKTINGPSVRLTARLLMLTGIAALPSTTWASDWNAGTSAFGTAGNWTPSGVPSGTTANITNGGTATITTGDNFSVTTFMVGGQSGTGAVSQDGGGISSSQFILGGSDANGSTGVGTYTMSGGTLSGGNGEMWIGSRGGTGNLNMTGGTLSNNNWIIFGRDTNATGNATLSGTATINKTGGGNIALSVFNSKTSTVTMSDSASMTSNNEIRVGWGNNSTATKGVLNMSGNSTATAGGNFQVALREGGGSAGPTGELHMSGNAIASAGNEFYIGSAAGANGTLTMDNSAKINVTNGFVVGRFDSTGIATVNGNSEIAIGGFNVVGDGPPANGTLIVNDNANVHSNRQLWLGLNNSHSTVTVNGGVLHASASLDGGAADPTGAGVSFSRFSVTPGGGTGTLNLNGGVLETPGFSKYDGTAQINLNGGTIKATGNTTTGSFFNGIGNAEINVQSGGAKIDTNGNSITIVQNLAGVGGLTKQGAGTLTLSGANAFTGATTIAGGTLGLAAAERISNASALNLTGGTLNLNNFNETLAALTLGSTSTIDFGATPGANTLVFADSSANGWSGVLNLENFEFGVDTLNFSSATGLTAGQLSAISLNGYVATGLTGAGNVTFTAVPEPGTVGIFTAMGLGALVGARRFRMKQNS